MHVMNNEESHFVSLAAALGRDDWLTDTRYAQREQRKAHTAELAGEIERELAKKTATEWEPLLQQAGVPSARLRGMYEALDSEQVKLRGFVQDAGDGTAVPTLPFRLGHAPAYPPSRPAPVNGEHTEELLQWLSENPED